MNPEIYSITADMEKHIPQNDVPQDARVRQNTLSFQLARLLVLLAEEAEKSARVTEKLTGRILYLTWTIVILTAVLLTMSLRGYSFCPKSAVDGLSSHRFLPELFKARNRVVIPDFKRHSLKNTFHNFVFVLTK